MENNNKMTYDSVLSTVNFCTMPDEKLLLLIDYLGHIEVTKNSECELKIKGGECIEKRWRWYDELIVTPKEIFFAPDPYPSRSSFTADKYAKLVLLFKGA